MSVGGIAARPCKERKDGAPAFVLLERKKRRVGTRPPKDINMRVPDDILKCVGFISHAHPAKLQYLGTVFIVATNDGMLHLVTAKHVAEVFDPGPFVVTMNARDGAPRFIKSGDDIRWYYHPTEPQSVDVAVCPFAVANLNLFDARSIQEKSRVPHPSFAKGGIPRPSRAWVF